AGAWRATSSGRGSSRSPPRPSSPPWAGGSGDCSSDGRKAGSMRDDEVWIELPPISPAARRRLIVFLHGRGSSAQQFAPVGIAWQLKFPGAAGVLMNARRGAAGHARNWFAQRPLEGRAERIDAAVEEFRGRLGLVQAEQRIGPEATMLVGFGQGATVALVALRGGRPAPASIVVAYACRLARHIRPGTLTAVYDQL